jgi:leucyl aminopeptidase
MNPSIFFDLGDTLGVPILSIDRQLERFDPFEFARPVLADLHDKPLRLGIISNTGDEPGIRVNNVLRQAGLLDYFDPVLLIYSKDVGLKKDSPKIFRHAAKIAGLESRPEECLFVGEDAHERSHALAAGWRVCPHPLLVGEVLDGEELRYARIEVPAARKSEPWRQSLSSFPLVPVQVDGPDGLVIYVITSQRTVAKLMNAQFRVTLVGEVGTPLRTELYLLRDDEAKTTGFLNTQGETPKLFAKADTVRTVLESGAGRILVALPPEVSLDAIHFENARHGHTLRLMADPHLLDLPAGAPAPAGLARAALPSLGSLLTDEEAAAWSALTPEIILDRVKRFTGQMPLQIGGTDFIGSRHVAHPDNATAVAALARELRDLAPDRLTVRLHQFSHQNLTLHNVVAELSGHSSELVLVTAHLDSIARPGNPMTDPAPGADDDMSGVAGVLAIAERCIALCAADGPPAHTVQFVLFNDEENGLVGSKAYARQLSAAGAQIAGVFQMDMIGFNQAEPRTWELHVGFSPSPETEARSLPLADLVARVAQRVSPTLPSPQIFGPGEEDPAEQRSDHASFHEHGYAACLISEDFFIGPGADAPEAEANPNYHKREDTFVDASYAADIARAVGAAAWKLASLGRVTEFEAGLADSENDAELQSFETWRSKLPKVTVDGVRYFVLHGDELRDETEIRTLWEKCHAPRCTERRAQPGEPLRFLDVSPDTPASEAESPEHKPTESNQ